MKSWTETSISDPSKFKDSRRLGTLSICRWPRARYWLGVLLLSVCLVGGLLRGPAAAQSCTASDTAVTAVPGLQAAERETLAADCAVLLDNMDILLGTDPGRGSLNWAADRSMKGWGGVAVANGRVTLIRLNDGRLTGQIPAALGDLDGLTSLSLFNNQLSGSIPDLSTLTKLKLLRLELNQLSGSIPDLSTLTKLDTLSLTNNQLSGAIPDLSALPDLTLLFLNRNQLSGAIPDLSALTKLQYIVLSNNQLSGSIPAALGSLTNLDNLHLADNPLTGGIPSELGNLASLTDLSLCGTDLDTTATLPAALEARSDLTVWSCVRIEDATALEGTSLSFSVERSTWPVRGRAGTRTLSYTITDDTTTSADYTGSAGSVTIPVNTDPTTATSTGTITIATAQDTDDEADETLTVSLSAAWTSLHMVRLRSVATGTIQNDDGSPPSPVSFASATASVSEGAGTHAVTLDLSPSTNITVNYTLSGSATRGGDYSITSAGTLAVTAGATTATIPVTISDDGTDEPDETIVLTLTGGDGYTLGSPRTYTLTITDNDEPVVSFASATASVSERAGTRTVRVNLAPVPHAALTLFYSLSGSADLDTDYRISGVTSYAGTRRVSANASSVDIRVTIINDSEVEESETVELTLEYGDGYTVGSPSAYTLTITAAATGGGGGGPTGGGGGGGGATVRDTHGNRPRPATDLPLSPSQRRPTEPGQLVSGRDVDYFRLELPQPGLLWVESRSSLDTRGRLFDADAGLLAEDDNSGTRRNFALATAVAKGTHYIAVDSPRGSTGAYTLALDYRPGYLGIPWAESIQSGIGVLSGWICEAAEVVLEIEAADGRLETYEAGAGTERQDTESACGHPDSGYGLLFNWANLAAGAYTVRAVVDGVVLDTHNVTIVPIGPAPFVRGLRGTYALADFPRVGATTQVVWSEAQQGFVIGAGEIAPGPADTPGDFTRYALGNPGSGTYQSGVGVLSGWACEAETVAVVITPETGEAVRVEAAYGTERRDTQAVCGDVDNGYGVLFNWNRLGDGEYVVDLLVDGQAVAQSTVRVTTLGAEFARGLRGTYALEGFPTPEQTTTIEWQQSRQNFGIVGVE